MIDGRVYPDDPGYWYSPWAHEVVQQSWQGCEAKLDVVREVETQTVQRGHSTSTVIAFGAGGLVLGALGTLLGVVLCC
ncbi:MAG: hypothetical protein U5L04_02370 [Trueperaceae bacterium]|nr:hypothetical protein [Trueperaceae bacterium]